MIAVMANSENEVRANQTSSTMAYKLSFVKKIEDPNGRIWIIISLLNFDQLLMLQVPNIFRLSRDDSVVDT